MKTLCAKTRMDTALCGCNPCETTVTQNEGPDYAALIHNGADLNHTVFPPLVQLVDGVIPEGYTVVAGAPKAGKSWFSLALCLAAASGGLVLGGIRVQRRDVLYLALEDGHRRIQARARDLLDGKQIPERFKYVLQVPKGDAVALIRHWLDGLTDPAAAVVVIDTAQKIRPPSRPGVPIYEADYDFGTSLKQVSDAYPGVSLIAVTHTRKAVSADFVEAVSGSNGFTGAADSIVVLYRARNSQEGTLSVTSRDGREGVYKVERSGAAWTLVGKTLDDASQAAEEFTVSDGLGDLGKQILAFVARHPDCSPSQIKAAMPDAAPGNVEQTLKRLTDSGRLVKPARGKYRHPVLSVVPDSDSINFDLLEQQLDQ